jgi:hypothetical protein
MPELDLSSNYPPATRGRLVVWGLLASLPFGGMTWQALHHLAGLRRLGFDVWYVEDSDRYVRSTVDYSKTTDYAANVDHLARFMDRLALGDRWVFRPPGSSDGCCGARDLVGLAELYRETDAVINVCGAQELRSKHSDIRCLIYIQTDPVADQVAVANGDEGKIRELDAYDYLFTYGGNLGAPDCLVPAERHSWLTTVPPVCTDWWQTAGTPPAGTALTTIARWRHERKDVTWQNESWHWSKDLEFRRFIGVASRSPLPLELATLAISEEEIAELRSHGWRTIRASTINDPDDYFAYIRSSLGELTAVKEQYVRPRSGWFSDRSVCYLAAGRPVIMQDTGFSNFLPTGEGLLAFSTSDEAVDAIESVAGAYERHAAAASEIAREFFDAERVLSQVLKKAGLM